MQVVRPPQALPLSCADVEMRADQEEAVLMRVLRAESPRYGVPSSTDHGHVTVVGHVDAAVASAAAKVGSVLCPHWRIYQEQGVEANHECKCQVLALGDKDVYHHECNWWELYSHPRGEYHQDHVVRVTHGVQGVSQGYFLE